MSGSNHSDDLFMYIKRQVTGLKPSAQYVLDVSVTIDTNAPARLAHAIGATAQLFRQPAEFA